MPRGIYPRKKSITKKTYVTNTTTNIICVTKGEMQQISKKDLIMKISAMKPKDLRAIHII